MTVADGESIPSAATPVHPPIYGRATITKPAEAGWVCAAPISAPSPAPFTGVRHRSPPLQRRVIVRRGNGPGFATDDIDEQA
ncbi:MAG: hypothetical protein M1118_12590 [Chloroflexi bacterium]|nr:hypothetical protein [Chloroflexota bacterium]